MKFKLSSLIYRLTGWVNPLIYKEILYSYMELKHKEQDYELDVYTGIWQAKHGFARPMKIDRKYVLKELTKLGQAEQESLKVSEATEPED